MLQDFQKQFPQSFAAHPKLMTRLTAEQQNLLDGILIKLSKAGLLNEQIVNCLFKLSYTHINELSYLINHLNEFKCLDQTTLQSVVVADLRKLTTSVSRMERVAMLSAEVLNHLISSPDSMASVDFIKRGHKAQVTSASIVTFLSSQVATEGLRSAIALFDISGLAYTERHFKLFALLTNILANPLCRVIFEARLRGFSDYTLPSDPLNRQSALSIMKHLSKLKSYEEGVAVFFDFFAEYRPIPPGQRDFVEIDLIERVTWELTTFCTAMIKAIDTREDYIKAAQVIKMLKNTGGSPEVFNAIKYQIASSIESEDLYSTRKYQDHMDTIWDVIKHPQVHLADFSEALRSSKGYQAMLTTNMQGHGLLMQSAAAAAASVQNNDKVIQKRSLSM